MKNKSSSTLPSKRFKATEEEKLTSPEQVSCSYGWCYSLNLSVIFLVKFIMTGSHGSDPEITILIKTSLLSQDEKN